MSDADALVARIAALAGIADDHTDGFGRHMVPSAETRRAILAGIGLPCDDAADARESLARIEQLRHGLVDPLVPVEAARKTRVPVRLGDRETAVWRMTDEVGATREGRGAVTAEGGRSLLGLPALAPGYYRLTVEAGGRTDEATVIAAPRRCWEPDELRRGARLWGVTAQVYGLRSAGDLGIGDYTSVAEAAERAGALGASFLGLSPVHALFSSDRGKISPYSPSSRLFLETLHLDLHRAGAFLGLAEPIADDPELASSIQALRHLTLVDHGGVWALKRRLLEALWTRFRDRGDFAAFEAFRDANGRALVGHATFETLSEHFFEAGHFWLGDWPEPYRRSGSEEVRRFQAEHAERIAFHAWLQWLADVQLGEAAARARASGMTLGLYRDLAVGSDRDGSEMWAAPERFASTLSIGAPPDAIAPNGQDWGLPPFDPLALENQGLTAFRVLVAANMRHAGAIRIDHAFQLRRLFLFPLGAQAEQGAYVRYPLEAMLAVLRLESHRARCLVIAEDLGNTPAGFTEAIMEAGVVSYRVLSFEREADGAFRRPADYPRRSLAAITTHDLPTFVGWWRGLDIDLRQTLGLYGPEMAEQERQIRADEHLRFVEALAVERLLATPMQPADPPLEAAVRYVARSASALAALQLEDAAGEVNQPNVPGVAHGHPNWQRRLTVDIDTLMGPGGELAKLAVAMADEGRGVRPRSGTLAAPPPRATYRLQFHEGFTFDDAAAIAPYLAALGVSHVYASPIHKARPGSTHGYDIVDHAAINPELGGEDGFMRLSDALKANELGLILDIVPNHMGIGGADNGWWLSVLEWGELSPHALAFDIDWERLGANGKLVVPVLGARYGEALEKGNLKLAFEGDDGSFSVWHFEHRLPVSPLSYPIVLDRALAALGDADIPADVLAISEQLRTMADEAGPERRAAFPDEAELLKRRLAEAVAASPALAEAVERAVALINGSPGVAESFGTLHRILEAQAYRPAYWRVAASDINYRRFFDINGLAGLRIEEPDIFERTHETIFRLVREGRVNGLRIDHVDGLADPEGYVRALQGALGPGFYLLVEKILEPGEALRPWPMAGTTGYDGLNLLDGLFVDAGAADALERIYRAASGLEGSYGALLRQAKAEVLELSFASELEGLVSDLKRIADADRRTRDFSANSLRRALTEIIARFPVYRSYLGDEEPSREDRTLIVDTIERAKRSSALADRSEHDLVSAALLGGIATEGPGRPGRELVRRFRRRFQQLTGPVMAKSLEDTLFYRYGRLLSLNEVGGDPGHFGIAPEAFHAANEARAMTWPHAMIATATHDTKRGEDARARIAALSAMPADWAKALDRWRTIAAPHLATIQDEPAPDRNDQYILFQALLGAWPMELLDAKGGDGAVASFRERMEGFVVKALREAKRHSSWVNPDEDYEKAALDLLRGLLDRNASFLDAFRPLAGRLAFAGMIAGLARTALKLTLPGVPDIYQGTEFWDLSLVDPDNRRPVDYRARAEALARDEPVEKLLRSWRDGRIKQRIVARILADRASAPLLYADGDYRGLMASGAKARHCLAFRRSLGKDGLVCAVPRLVVGSGRGKPPLGEAFWGDTTVPVPQGRWREVVSGAAVEVGDGGIPAGNLFARLPIAVLRTIT